MNCRGLEKDHEGLGASPHEQLSARARHETYEGGSFRLSWLHIGELYLDRVAELEIEALQRSGQHRVREDGSAQLRLALHVAADISLRRHRRLAELASVHRFGRSLVEVKELPERTGT